MKKNSIPKKIHYCWFGGKKKPLEVERLINTWKKYCPDYEINEWNENNFNINSNEYTKKAYLEKKWAFVSDYVRCYALYNEGGIYLDTDIEILKNFDNLLENECFLAFESPYQVGGSVIGSIKNHPFLKECIDFYKNRKRKIIFPHLLNKLLSRHGLKINNLEQDIFGVKIYKNYYFYPFAYYEKYSPKMIKNDTYAIHWYSATWLPCWIPKYIFPVIGLYKKLFY